MRSYIRDKTKGGTYFLTMTLSNRKSRLLTKHVNEFRHAYRLTKQNHDFELNAMVLLPDHIHMLITLAEDSDNYAVIIASIKTHFSRQIKKSASEIITHSRVRSRERGIWQRRFWEHRIRDDLDYQHHMDYIHYNAVKHGYVTRPIDWSYSTFQKCVEDGFYSTDWGGVGIDGIEVDYD
ncbi:transposase [Psychrobacter okhotskensis]|uniref:REP-associated tyrosine transposase n=1 Tax=Psychrobacter okhotskensis TaxID=212403 RepID=UPI001566DFF7|nr:transposase [Psychrobacter okhotskensis]NRD68952.1 transposase [Psychrobacter okhotskensis]